MILITGVAGFIGFHLSKKLLKKNLKVIGIDNLNNYYDVKLKESRLQELIKYEENFIFKKIDLLDFTSLNEVYDYYSPKIVIHLAAQVGVRYSLINPKAYIDSNIVGFSNILELCRISQIEHLIYASSSSVYGGNSKTPFSECDNVDNPVSLYAASKKANELMAYSYSHLYKIPSTGLRFFTVYGPWGRPDMAPMIFTKAIINKKEIEVFNYGDMARDFTYIDDVIEVICRLLNKPPLGQKLKNSSNLVPYNIFNVGNNKTIKLLSFINLLEKELGKKSIKNFKPFQKGDVKVTSSDTNKIKTYIEYKPNTPIEVGIKKFVSWYNSYYKLNI